MEQEKRWIKKIKRNGNEEAANQLISKYYKEIYAFVYKQTLDMDISLDLTQEIFISVLKSLDRFDEKKASFRTWLYRIASNRVVDYFRSQQYQYRKLAESIEGVELRSSEDLTVNLEYKEDLEKVIAIVNEMETSSQQIIRLKLFSEYTLQEIAEMLQVPLSTVKSRYYSVLRKIKANLEVNPVE